MTRTVTLKFQDGSEAVYKNVPDSVTPEQVIERARAEYGQTPVELDGGRMGPVERKARIAGASAVRGTVGLPALAADLAGNASQYLPTTPFGVPPNPLEVAKKPIEFPISRQIQNLGPKPETTGEKYLAAAIEGASGGLISAPKMALQSVITGLGAGLGSEFGAQVSGDEDAFLPRILGGLAGGGVTSLAAGRFGPNPRIQEIAREALDHIPQNKLQEAKSFMQAAGREGVTLDAAQGLEGVGVNPGAMQVLRDRLANLKEGSRTQVLLEAQPGELQQRAATWLGGTPGNVYSPEQAANNLSETATAVLQSAKDARQTAWETAYRQKLADNMKEAVEKLREASAQSGVASSKLAALRASIDKLKQQQDALEEAAAKMRTADLDFKPPSAPTPPQVELPAVGVDSRGNLRPLNKVGEAIIFNQIAKEVYGSGKFDFKLPPIQAAPTLPTLSMEAAAKRQAGRVDTLQNYVPKYAETAAKAEEALQGAKAGVRAVREVPTEIVEQERQRLQKLAIQAVPSTAKGKALLQLSKDLEGLTNGEQINEVLKNAVAKTKTVNLDTPGMDAATAKWVQRQVNELRDNFGKSFSPLREANTVYKQQTRDVIDPLKQGQIGALATRRGYQSDTQASVAKMNSLFSAGRDPAARHSPILATARKLNQQNPDAFRDAAKTYYSGVISNAFDSGVSTRSIPTDRKAAETIYKQLFEKGPQYLAMQDTITGIAEGAGQSPAAALRGLNSFAKIVKAAKNQPDVLGGMTPKQIAEMAERHYGASVLRIFGMMPIERLARNAENRTMSKTLRELDRLITTPEGLEILAELSKHPVMSRQAAALAATAGGVLATMGERTDQITPE